MDARTTPASAVHPGTNARSAPAPDALSAARRIGAGSARARPVGADARSAPVSGARRAHGRAISGSARARLTGADARPAPVAGARRADGRAIPGSARAPVAAANRRSAAAPAAPPAGNQRLRFGRVGTAGAARTNGRQQAGAVRSGAPQPVAAPRTHGAALERRAAPRAARCRAAGAALLSVHPAWHCRRRGGGLPPGQRFCKRLTA